jgi:hypothetical protein
MGGCLPDSRAATRDGGNGAPITDVVIKRIHDAVRILRLKKTPKPTETFSRGTGSEMTGRRLPRSNGADGNGGSPATGGEPALVKQEPDQSNQRKGVSNRDQA